MALPKITPKTKTLTLSDKSKVTIRGLTRAEALSMQEPAESGDLRTLEVAMLAAATDTPIDAAGDWYDAAPQADAGLLVEAVLALSGMAADSGKGSSGA